MHVLPIPSKQAHLLLINIVSSLSGETQYPRFKKIVLSKNQKDKQLPPRSKTGTGGFETTSSLTKSEGFLEFLSVYIVVVTESSSKTKDVSFTILCKATPSNLKTIFESQRESPGKHKRRQNSDSVPSSSGCGPERTHS